MNEFIPIKNNKDIKRFLDETNSLHDGYIISVNYSNNSITRIDGGFSFAPEATKLNIRILVTLPRGLAKTDPFCRFAPHGLIRPFLRYAHIAMTSVPASISPRPSIAFFDSFSPNTKYEKATAMRTLILSIGTTTLTTPFAMA